MICQNCNAQMEDNAKFCPVCGTPTGIVEKPDQAQNAPPPEAAENVAPAFTENFQTQPTPTKKKFWKTDKASGLNKFFIVLLAIVLFFTSFISLFLLNAKTAISEGGIESSIETVVEDVSFEELVDNFGLEEFLEEFKYRMRMDHYAIITNDSIKNVLLRSTIKAFIAEKVANFIEDTLKGKYAELSITHGEICDLLVENKEILSEEFEVYLNNDDIYSIANIVTPHLGGMITSSERIIDGEADEIMEIADFSLSALVLIVLLLLSLLIVFAMLKINLPKGTSATAVIFIIISTIYLLIDFVGIPVLMSLIGYRPELINTFINGLFTPSTIVSIILLVLSIAALVFLKIKKVKAKKANTFNTYQ